MSETESARQGWTFLAWWIVWIAAVALVSLGLGYVWPSLRLAILLVDMALFFAFPGHAAGRAWTAMTREMRSAVSWAAALLVLVPTAYDLVKEMVQHERWLLLYHLALYAAMAAGMLGGFCLGRRRRRS